MIHIIFQIRNPAVP